MAVYKFRVTFEDQDDVSRDIEIKPGQTFADFDNIIRIAINFDSSESGHFFQSDDYWRKENEIEAGNLANSKILRFIEDPHQKFLYEYGISGKWGMTVELLKILPDENGTEYPRIIKSTGKAPAQYFNTNIEVSEEDDITVTSLLADDIDDAGFYSAPEEITEFEDEDEKNSSVMVEEEENEDAENSEEDFDASDFSDNEDY